MAPIDIHTAPTVKELAHKTTPPIDINTNPNPYPNK